MVKVWVLLPSLCSNPSDVSHCSRVYTSGENVFDQPFAFAKTENLEMSVFLRFAAREYVHTKHSFGYTQFDAHER